MIIVSQNKSILKLMYEINTKWEEKTMKIHYFLCVPIAVLFYCSYAAAWTYTIINQTTGKIAVKLDLIASEDEDVILEPGERRSVSTGLRPLRALEVRGLSEPISTLDAIYKLGFPLWNYEFYVRHKDYKYVDPEQVDVIFATGSAGSSGNMVIYPGTGELVISRR